MFRFLKNHPFAVDAHFDTSIVLTFAAKADELRTLVPSRLELDTFQDEWGFVAVAVVQTKDLRPWFMPRLFGNDFVLIGYRVFVRYTNKIGKRMRGLYILKSETNSKRMEILGNTFTHYNYSTIDVSIESRTPITTITSEKGGLEIELKTSEDDPPLPEGSPFKSWKEARRYAGPLPFTFTVGSNSVLIIEGVRQEWSPRPVEVVSQRIDFLQALGLKTMTLANAFIVENIPYHWKKGRLEEWSG
jgi:hypothetical protein